MAIDLFDNQPSEGGAVDLFANTGASPKKQNKGIASDLVTDLKRGIEQLPGIVTGVADIPIAAITGDTYADKAANALGGITGFAPAKWAKDAEAEYSPGRVAAKSNVNQAWEDNKTPFADAAGGDFAGIGQIAKSYIQNPQQLVGSVVESLPSMLGGAKAGQALTKAAGIAAPWLAGAAGEGGVMAGQQMNQLTEAGADPRTAAAASAATGVAGAAIGAFGGKLAQRLGVVDPDTALAGGATRALAGESGDQTTKGAIKEGAKRIAGGAASEGLFEELPQSVLEQVLSNLAQGKPWEEGVGRSAVEGTLAGSLMGGAFNALPGKKAEPADTPPAGDEPPTIAGLLPPPTYTGTPGERIVAADSLRQDAIDKADAANQKLWEERDAYAKWQEELKRNNITIINDPEPLQQRIDALMGINESRLQGAARTNYEKAIENAFGEQVGIVVGKDGLEVTFTMADYLKSKIAVGDMGRKGQSKKVPDAGIAAAPVIPMVGPLSNVANMAVQSGAHQATVMQQAAEQSKPIQESSNRTATQPTAPAQGPLTEVAGQAPNVATTAPNPVTPANTAPAATTGDPFIQSRSDAQLNWLAERGKPELKAAAVAEIQQRQGNVYPNPPATAEQSSAVANEQQAGAGLPASTAGGSRPAPVANQEPVKNQSEQPLDMVPAIDAVSQPKNGTSTVRGNTTGTAARDDLVGAIMRVTGNKGISPSIAPDTTGDKAGAGNPKLRGLFINGGTEDLGDIAELLRVEEGFDVRDGDHLSELIRNAAAGDVATSMERTESDADANEESRRKDYYLKRAAELGLKWIGGKRKIETVVADVEAKEAEIAREESALSKLEAEAERRAIQAADAIDEALGQDMTEADFMRWMAHDVLATYTEEEITRAEEDRTNRENARAQTNAAFDAEERAQGDSRQRDGNKPAAPQGGRTEAGTGNAEGLTLAGQTNAQAAAEFKRQQEEAAKKDDEPAAPTVKADQVDLFNTQDSLFNSNRDAAPVAKAAEQSAAVDAKTAIEKRNIWIPNMTVSKLEKLLSKQDRTADDIEDLKDFKYFLLTDEQSAIEKGFMVGYKADEKPVYVLKNKFWLTNIDDAISRGPATVDAKKQEEAKPEIETDQARVQEVKNSIAEGELILKSSKTVSGRKMDQGEIDAVKRSVDSARAKIGEKSAATADAGEELTYNKRNRRTGGLKWEDIKDKNAALRVKEVVKAKVYPKPDYQALVDGGMRDVVAHIVKQAYDAIAPAPKMKRDAEVSDAALQSYIAGVNRVMDGVTKWANDGAAVAKWASAQPKLSGVSFSISELATAESLLDTVYPGGWKASREEIIMIGGNKMLSALQPGHDEVGRAMKDIKLGWPAKSESWQKQGYKVVNAETVDVELYSSPQRDKREAYVSGTVTAGNQRIDSFIVRGTADKESQEVQDAIAEKRKQLEGNYVLVDKVGRIEGAYADEEAAIEAARDKVKRESGEIKEVGRKVSEVGREGVEHRLPGDDVTTERLKEAFGFRGVNFGNWMKGETKAKTAERQLHLNHLFDAFMDLAQLLNVPPKAMSLNGMLGIAVGAQGSGKAWAHFVPGVNEINVTRANGAGALAHEWGHALDHHFATMGGMDRSKEPYLSAHVGTLTNRVENGRYVRSPVELVNVRPEVAAQFQSIVEAMTKRKETDAEYADRIRRDKDIAGQMVADEIKKITEDIGQAKGGWGTPSFIAEIRGLAERIAALDYGDGRVSIGSSEVPAVVAEIAEAYRAASGAPLKNAETLGYYADHYRVMSGILESEDGRTPRDIQTDYKKASDAADSKKKPYWSTKLEMFARAFDAYVVDSLAEKAASNTYLAGIEAVAPQGDERKTIGKAFDFLFAELKTKETEQGVMLYNQASAGKISPADKAIYGMVAEGKSAAEVLKFIASASRSPFNRQVAKLLLKTGIAPSVTVGDGKGWKMNAGEGNKYAAGYSPKTDTISLFRPASAERNMLHEMMHAATLKALAKKGMASAQMNALYRHVKKSGKLKGMYGMSDVDEFIAEAFSNPKFQAALKQVPAMPVGGKPSSAWDWFVRVVRGILGLKQGQDNALSQALDIGVGVMRENMGASEVDGDTRYSQSAMKNIDANIRRGRFSLAKAVAEKTSVHRAMFRNGLGWVDFVWGDEGTVKPSGKTKGAMGLSHILEARARKDGMSGEQISQLLDNIVSTIANGKEIRRYEFDGTVNATIEHDGVEAVLTKSAGANVWLLNGWNVKNPGVSGVGNVTTRPTSSTPTTTQRGDGAGFNSNIADQSEDGNGIRYNVADEGWNVSEQAKEVVMRLAGRPMLDPADPFAAENARLREQDQSLWSKAKKQLRRYLAPGGLLPQSVFAEKIKRDSEFQAVEFDVRHLIGGLEHAVKADFGMAFDKLSKEQMRPITEALAGNVPASLPEATKTAAVAMRQYIDGMSTKYLKIIQQKIDAKMLKSLESGKDADKAQAINDIELFEKIKGNIGRYVHRSYQAFDDPKWFEKVPASVLNASRLYLKQGYMEAGETDAKASQMAEVTLHEILKNGTAYDSMESFIAESKLGAKDLSVLMRRKEVPPQIRALLGEYPDARLNFTKSATKMGRLIWNTRFLDRVRDMGMGSFFFEGKDRPPNATTQIAADGSEAYAPLNGLWTFPEIAQAFKDALGKEQMSDLYRAIVRANGLVKYGKTVLAPTTAMRNWQSAMFFSLANGHFDLTQMKKSISAFREQVSQKATGQDLKYLRHLKQLGVVYDTPYAGEMARLMEDARMEELLSSDKGDAVRWFRKANQLAQGFYTFGDDFWKIIGFENEKAGLMKAGLSLQEAEIEAAKRIRDTYPTYSMVGRGIQWLSRFPLAGTFVSFPAEIIRTSGNMLRTVAADLKSDNPKLRELGMKRAAGMVFVSAAFYSLAALSMAMAGVGDDEDEAIRDLAPEWQKNSTFLYLGRDEKGNLRYFDMSFLDPYGYWKRPITAMLRNQPWEDSLASGLRGMLEPFLGADISAKAIFEAVSNAKESGGKVYKENDGAIDQAVDIADHLRKALQPGVVGNIERLVKAAGDVRKSSGQPYSMEDELVALVGWRATTIEPKTALYYRSFEFTDSIAEARKTLTDTLRDANEVSPEDIKDARERAKSKQDQAFKEMNRLVGAAEAAGMSKMQIVQTLRLSNISQANIGSLMRGATPDVSITPQLAARAVRQASQMRGPEFAADVFDRYRQAMAK